MSSRFSNILYIFIFISFYNAGKCILNRTILILNIFEFWSFNYFIDHTRRFLSTCGLEAGKKACGINQSILSKKGVPQPFKIDDFFILNFRLFETKGFVNFWKKFTCLKIVCDFLILSSLRVMVDGLVAWFTTEHGL